jgi:preprotein translocase subunit SecE
VVVGAVFAFSWYKGYLLKVSTYVQQTREELRKCTWPSWDELKGSTVLVFISMLLLGVFVYLMDRVFFAIQLWILKV